MVTTYAKSWLSIQQQLDLLKNRGLTVSDDAGAKHLLETIGYYRLSGYWYPFRQLISPGGGGQLPVRGDDFLPGSRFEDVAALYLFDKGLRSCLMEAIDSLETSVRSRLAHYLGKRSTFAHEEVSFFEPQYLKGQGRFTHQRFLDKLRDKQLSSREDFVLHYRQKYGDPFPIWVSVELWEFGMLSQFYSGLRQNHRVAVSAQFGVANSFLFSSWLNTLNYVRNLAAHHSRVWNRELVHQPKLPKSGEIPQLDILLNVGSRDQRKIFSALSILVFLLETAVDHLYAATWRAKIVAATGHLPRTSQTSTAAMGFPANWLTSRPWSP